MLGREKAVDEDAKESDTFNRGSSESKRASPFKRTRESLKSTFKIIIEPCEDDVEPLRIKKLAPERSRKQDLNDIESILEKLVPL